MHALPTPLPRTLSSSWLAADTRLERTLTRWHMQPGPVQQLLPLLVPQPMLLDLPSRPQPPAMDLLRECVLLSPASCMPDADRASCSSPAAVGPTGTELDDAVPGRCAATAAASCHSACVEPGGMNRADTLENSSTQAAGYRLLLWLASCCLWV